MTNEEATALLKPLYAEFTQRDDWLRQEPRPLLAHYTSIDTVEKILRSEEVWLSNPLFMNDLEEMRFGLNAGMQKFLSKDLCTLCSVSGHKETVLRETFSNYFRRFEAEHALKVYVLCLSGHQADNTDGVLSMWRAYGSSGNGAALVFDTGKITITEPSPLILVKVEYKTTQERLDWLERKILDWAEIVRANEFDDEHLFVPAFHILNCMILFSLSYKHCGFNEENEYRLIYMPDRDTRGLLENSLDYVVTSQGVQPKLKLKIGPMQGVMQDNMSLSGVLHSILLGPSASSPLARGAVIRMLQKLGKPELISKVHSSSIPLRPR